MRGLRSSISIPKIRNREIGPEKFVGASEAGPDMDFYNKKIADLVSEAEVNLIDHMGKVSQISERADVLKDEAISSEAGAKKMCLEFNNMLKTAVDKAKVINEIGSLTQDVLRVASQINLISLNASIEAARG